MNTQRLTQIEAGLWRWIGYAIKHPWQCISGLVVLAAIGLYLAATGLGINSDTSQMVSSELPHRQAQFAFEDAFPDDEDKVALIIRARSEDEADAFAAAVVARLEDRQDAITGAFSPALDPFFRKNALLYLDIDELDQVLARLSQSAPILKRLGASPDLDALFDSISDGLEAADPDQAPDEAFLRAFDALSETIEGRLAGTPEPLSWQAIFAASEEGDIAVPGQRIVSLTPVLDMTRLQPARVAVDAIKQAVDETMATGEFEVYAGVTGNSALRSEELGSVRDGIGFSFLLSIIFVAVLLTLALREAALVFTALGSLIISICITAGFAGVVYDALNLVSVAFLVLMVGLGIDFAIHLGLHAQEERCAGRDARSALFRTTRQVGGALVLCAPTSAVAFFAFAPTQFIGMAQLGVVSGVGVLVAFMVAITLLPAVFSLRSNKAATPPHIDHTERMRRLKPLGAMRTRAAIITLGLGVLSLPLLPHVRFDADPMGLRDPNAPSVQAFDLLFDDIETQPFNLSVIAPNQAAADLAASELEELDVVRRTLTIQDFVPDDQDEKLELIEWSSFGLLSVFEPTAPLARPADALAPLPRLRSALEAQTSAEAARLRTALGAYAAALEASPELKAHLQSDVFRFWPQQYERLRDLLNPGVVTEDDLPKTLRAQYIGIDGQRRVLIEPEQDLRSEQARAAFVDTVRAANPGAAGSARSVLESGRVISRAMLIAVLGAFIAVSLLLWIILRDILLVSVILFTLGLAGLLTTSAAVLLNVPYNFANVIVLPLLIGVGADSGVHLGIRARRGAAAAAVYDTSTPKAVMYSALTTIASFGTLILSAHRGVQTMGILLSLAIGFTLICTLIVQPWLLEKLGHSASDSPKTAS